MTVTVTDVVEHVFCPKFTYYSSVLGLEQYQGKRGTVRAGRRVHARHEKSNTGYTPSRFAGEKMVARRYYSGSMDLSGKIDEAIKGDDEIVLVERKHTNHTALKDTLKAQLGLLAMLVEENEGRPVRTAHVIFTKDNKISKNYAVDGPMRAYALGMLNETKAVISGGTIPDSEFDGRCANCCFRKICPTGLLGL